MYPFVVVAAVVAIAFLIAFARRPRPAALLALVLWSSYAVYEYFIANGTLCDANCNIRVDLLLFLPLLGLATYLGLKRDARTASVAALLTVCFALVALIAVMFGSAIIAGIGGIGALAAAVWVVTSWNAAKRA